MTRRDLLALLAAIPSVASGMPAAPLTGSRPSSKHQGSTNPPEAQRKPGPAILVGARDVAGKLLAEADRPQGACKDLDAVRKMLIAFGWQQDNIVELSGEKATKDAVEKALNQAEQSSRAGESAVFYYSGYGSVFPGEGTNANSPALILARSLPADASHDLLLDTVSDWAGRLVRGGVLPVVIVDASFSAPDVADRAIGQGDIHSDYPRTLMRTGSEKVRSDIWRGGAGTVFLGASDSQGFAYEWLVNPNDNQWQGIFTKKFVEAAVTSLKANWVKSPAEIMTGIRQFFATQPGLINNLRLCEGEAPPGGTQWSPSSVYVQAIFGAAGGTANMASGGTGKPGNSAAAQIEIDRQMSERHQREMVLRVAVQCLPANSTAQARDSADTLAKSVRKILREAFPGGDRLCVLEQFETQPERAVRIQPDSHGGFDVRITGTEIVSAFTIGRSVRDRESLDAYLSGDLAEFLRFEALVKRLYVSSSKIARSAQDRVLVQKVRHLQPGSDSECPPEAMYHAGDQFALKVALPHPGWLFVLERRGDDGAVQLVWPRVDDPQNHMVSGGNAFIPRANLPLHPVWGIGPETPAGPTTLRLFLFPELTENTGDVSLLPALPETPGLTAENYLTALRKSGTDWVRPLYQQLDRLSAGGNFASMASIGEIGSGGQTTGLIVRDWLYTVEAPIPGTGENANR